MEKISILNQEEVEELYPPGHTKTVSKKLLSKNNSLAEHIEIFISHMDPGGRADPEIHDFEQAFYVLEGKVQITVEGKKFEAGPSSVVFVPPKTEHSMRNTGDTQLTLLGVNAQKQSE